LELEVWGRARREAARDCSL